MLSEMAFLKPRRSVDGIPAFDCPKDSLVKAAKILRDKFECQSLADIASVDMGEDAGNARFGAVYHFFSHTKKKYVRIVCMCESGERPVLPSLCSIYKGADWHEREAFDMMGIVFDGHPNLRRILMWDAYPWHPLRKDFPLAGKEGSPLPPTFEDEDEAERERYQDLVPMFQRMGKLSAILRKRRQKRGSIDFDFPESKLILDEQGMPLEIRPYERNVATKLIEDFMLLANETVAEDYYWQELPFLYRTHEQPDSEKIRALAIFINNFGYSMHVGQNEVRPKEIQKLLAKVEGSDEEALISRLALRSMKQARYSPENTGHFGLAANYYTHFTSPIRRYPDLQIHRIIKDSLRGRMNPEKIEHYETILPEVARASSELERRADEAERETVRLKKAQYMSRHVGEIYEGVISGLTRWGMYVELKNTVEGLIHVANMTDDHYDYDEGRCLMTGTRTGKTYRLGQRLAVRVIGADVFLRTVDFEIADEGELEDGKDNECETGCQ